MKKAFQNCAGILGILSFITIAGTANAIETGNGGEAICGFIVSICMAAVAYCMWEVSK